MTEREAIPSRAAQTRALFPRWPSDRFVWAVLVAGLLVAAVARVEIAYGLIPGAVAGLVQHVNGHLSAWRRGGVEKAFIMESSAISFYVVVIGLILFAVADTADLLHVELHWLAVGAMYVDTIVRSVRERRFV